VSDQTILAKPVFKWKLWNIGERYSTKNYKRGCKTEHEKESAAYGIICITMTFALHLLDFSHKWELSGHPIIPLLAVAFIVRLADI